MSYKTLILHVEPTDLGRERIRVALTIAQIFDSRLVGIGARALNPMPDPIGLSIVKLREAVEAGLAAAEAVFRQEIPQLVSGNLPCKSTKLSSEKRQVAFGKLLKSLLNTFGLSRGFDIQGVRSPDAVLFSGYEVA